MDRSAAAEVFANFLYRVGVTGGWESFFESLEKPAGEHRAEWEGINQMYASQSEEGRRAFRFAVREALVLAVFGLAVHLDGAAEYVYVGDRPAEFTVGLSIYESLQRAKEHAAAETVDVCPTRRGVEVHDLLLDLVEEEAPEL